MHPDIGPTHANTLNLLTLVLNLIKINEQDLDLLICAQYCIKFYSTDILIF